VLNTAKNKTIDALLDYNLIKVVKKKQTVDKLFWKAKNKIVCQNESYLFPF